MNNMEHISFEPQPSDITAARRVLESGQFTCVLCKGGQRYTATERGVKPLVRWLESGIDTAGFCAADKVVGRATAFLYCLLGVRAVHAQVMSITAAQVLKTHGIAASWDRSVEYIINRQGNGMCPFEAAVLDISDPKSALSAIQAKMAQMNITL